MNDSAPTIEYRNNLVIINGTVFINLDTVYRFKINTKDKTVSISHPNSSNDTVFYVSKSSDSK